MKVRMVFQPFEDDLCLYEALELALVNKKLTELTVVVAWAKASGLKRIRPMLQDFRARGGAARVLLGIDEGGATIEGLHSAIDEFDEALVLFDAASGTFHPKLYMITGEAASIVIIGSSNLTKGGLFSNYEAGTYFELNLDEDADLQIHETVTQYIQRLQDDETSRPLTEELIQQLLDDASFNISSEAQHGTSGAADDSLGFSGSSEGAALLFGMSHHKKKPDPAPNPATKKSAAKPGPTASRRVHASFGSVHPTVGDINRAITWLADTAGGHGTFTAAMKKDKNPLANWAKDGHPGLKTWKGPNPPPKPRIADYLREALVTRQDADTGGA